MPKQTTNLSKKSTLIGKKAPKDPMEKGKKPMKTVDKKVGKKK